MNLIKILYLNCWLNANTNYIILLVYKWWAQKYLNVKNNTYDACSLLQNVRCKEFSDDFSPFS